MARRRAYSLQKRILPKVCFLRPEVSHFRSATMVKGQKVVCINDTFSPAIRALYKQLPVKDNIYTVREVFLGREKIVKGGDTATVGLLLEELKNPRDPFHQGEQELGFSSERFAPLNELPDEEAEVEEAVGVGAWAPV